MKIAPSSAATNASGWKVPSPSASEVPTSTGAIAAGSVRSRAAISQMRTAEGAERSSVAGAGHQARRGNCEKSGLRFSR